MRAAATPSSRCCLSYRPVGVANWQRAICLDLTEKVPCSVTCLPLQTECLAASLPSALLLPVGDHHALYPLPVPLLPGGRAGLLRRNLQECPG